MDVKQELSPFAPKLFDHSIRTAVAMALVGRAGATRSPYPKHLHHLVVQVVDDLDGDMARFGLGEREEMALFKVVQAPSFISARSVKGDGMGLLRKSMWMG